MICGHQIKLIMTSWNWGCFCRSRNQTGVNNSLKFYCLFWWAKFSAGGATKN